MTGTVLGRATIAFTLLNIPLWVVVLVALWVGGWEDVGIRIFTVLALTIGELAIVCGTIGPALIKWVEKGEIK